MKNSSDFKQKVLLPGTDKQAQLLFRTVQEPVRKILAAGSSTVPAAVMLRDNYSAEVTIIVEDEDSLINDRLMLKGEQNISVRLMDFTTTDFKPDSFDLVYAQASVSGKRRNKIIKEFSRVLVNDGILCAGEITQLRPDPLPFIKNIWDISDIFPLDDSEIISCYTSKNFELIAEENLSWTLTEYYSTSYELLNPAREGMQPNEQSYYKKLLNRVSHESNAYLKLGGDKYMGYRVLILKKRGR